MTSLVHRKQSIRTISVITENNLITITTNFIIVIIIIFVVSFFSFRKMMKNLKSVASQNLLLPNRLKRPTKKQNKIEENDW